MRKTGLILASLIPRPPFIRNELDNLQELADSIDKYIPKTTDLYQGFSEITLIVGSAHQESLTAAKNTLKLPSNVKLIALHCPFIFHPQHSEERAHEIGFSKRYIHQYILDMKMQHILFWIDSDMVIPVEDIMRYINRMTHSSIFINFPYCLRGAIYAPPEQFGCYALNTARLTPSVVSEIYQTALAGDGTIIRPGAPDCRLRVALLRDKAVEIRAEDINSKHYDEEDFVYYYAKGGLSRRHR